MNVKTKKCQNLPWWLILAFFSFDNVTKYLQVRFS
jgi:hypothetical protein